MAIQFVGGATIDLSDSGALSLTSLTGGIDTEAREGDLVLVVIAFSGTANGNPQVNTAGFVELRDSYANDVIDSNLGVYYKLMTSTPDASVNCTASFSTAYAGVAVASVWRNIDQTAPLFGTSPPTPSTYLATGIDSAVPNPPAITPSTFGSVIISAVACATDTTPVDFTAPTDFGNLVSAKAAGTTGGIFAGIAAYTGWSSGAYDPDVWGAGETNTDLSWIAVTLAIQLGPETKTVTTSSNSTLKKLGATVTASASGAVQKSSALAVGADSRIVSRLAAACSINAALQRQILRPISCDARVVRRHFLTNLSANAIISKDGWVVDSNASPNSWNPDGAASGGWTPESAVSGTWS